LSRIFSECCSYTDVAVMASVRWLTQTECRSFLMAAWLQQDLSPDASSSALDDVSKKSVHMCASTLMQPYEASSLGIPFDEKDGSVTNNRWGQISPASSPVPSTRPCESPIT
jgi:hypothetical protein